MAMVAVAVAMVMARAAKTAEAVTMAAVELAPAMAARMVPMASYSRNREGSAGAGRCVEQCAAHDSEYAAGRARASSPATEKAEEDVLGSYGLRIVRPHSPEGDRPHYSGPSAGLGLLGLLGAPARRAR